jgi:tellurite resistance-related uncharacterized protein
MTGDGGLPEGLEHVRTSPTFDETTVPPALLAAHRVASGVWGRLVVDRGIVGFVFEDEPGRRHAVGAGESMVIPPDRPHHLIIDEPVTFAVEFHRRP